MSNSSSTEEDTDLLRDLVATTLDKNGVLGKIKAQLRAHVYLSLEAEQSKTKTGHVNSKLATFLSTTNGRLVASLVREFLQFFDLEFCLAVFDPETNIGKDVQYRERPKLFSALGLTELTDPHVPLLSEIMRLSKVSVLKSESPTPSTISDSVHTSGPASLADDPPSHHSTPDISLKDQNILESAIMATTYTKSSNITSPRDQPISMKETVPKELPQKDRPKDTKSSVSKPSFLSDLPPLGRSSLGDLPPLSLPPARGLGLAPLKQPKATGDSLHEVIASTDVGKKLPPSFGFDQDHVLSEKSDSINKFNKAGNECSGTTTPDMTENIEEELDSFLNSDISEANDVTKDETLGNSDASLKADYIESLK